MLLEFATRYLGWLKRVPFLPLFWDQFVKIETVLFRPKVLDLVDAVVDAVSDWPQVELTLHRFGGLEFKFSGHEFGHLHSNGLLDIYFGRDIRTSLLTAGTVEEHHVYPSSGWISFRIRTDTDVPTALDLLGTSYLRAGGLPAALVQAR